MKHFWLLANFGVLQRAPAASQREILNCVYLVGYITLKKNYQMSNRSAHVIMYGKITNTDILEIIWSF